MSDDNKQPDEMLDFNTDEFLGDSSPYASPIPGNIINTDEVQPTETMPKLPNGKWTKKADYLKLDGNTLVTTEDGETGELSIWRDKLKMGEKKSIHCLDPDHRDEHASAWMTLNENGNLFWHCSSCGKKGWCNNNNSSIDAETGLGKGKKNNDKEKAPSPEDAVMAIANSFYLFRDEQDNTYAEITLHGRKNIVPIMAGDFANAIRVIHYDKTERSINSNVLNNVILTKNACTKFGGNVEVVALRNHKFDNCTDIEDCVYINVGDDAGRVIMVDKYGYRYVTDSKVKFITTSRMKALPDIAVKGDITLLRKHLKITDEELPLVYGWLLSTVAGMKPYLILSIQGVAGSSKSVTARVLQSLADPSISFSGAIKNTRDFAFACANGCLIIQDNVSKVSLDIANMMCLASTGGTDATKVLYTTNDILTVVISNPLITTSINNISNQGDLAERTAILNLPYMQKSERKDDAEFWSAFNGDRSAIFTGILDGIVSGFRHIDGTKLDSLPRMAGAAKWITACEQGLGMGGNFIKAFTVNQDMACLDGIDASPAGMALKLFIISNIL